MAHGHPDWRRGQGSLITFLVTDLGELAARLGSIDTYDKRGDVLWMETFEAGLGHWELSPAGTGSRIGTSAQFARNGTHSCFIIPGSDAGLLATITRHTAFTSLSPWGIEFHFMLRANITLVSLRFTIRDGATLFDFRARLDRNDASLKVLVPPFDLATVATGVLTANQDGLFHPLKLVVDPVTRFYRRFLFGHRTVDISSRQPVTSADATAPRITIEIEVTGTAGQNPALFLDDVILTQNEP